MLINKPLKIANKKQSLLLILTVLSMTVLNGQPINQGDFFTNIGKIYVVVGVIVLVFIGLVIFLIRLEKRISRLEGEITKS